MEKIRIDGSELRMNPCEEIVISGIAGRFPESNNMKELQDNLMNKVDMITDDNRRWKLDHPEIPQRTGKIYNIDKFDASFFGVHSKQAHSMDPMCRMLMEHAYEAIVDAGVNPRQLRGSKTGIFIGACFSESEQTVLLGKEKYINGFGVTGCNRAMLANRLSYWLGVTGPSYAVDSGCSSSLFAMDHAYRAIKNGQCEAALVGAVNLCLHPYMSLQFSRLGALSPDGRCKTFDADANGFTRSEAVTIVYLQKSKDAKRVYATVVHSKTNCDGFKEQGITFPSSTMQSALLREFYDECKISPKSVAYIEAHGTGTKAGDPEEVNAIDSVLCHERTEPLKIGSIKTNLGHAEPASGMCSIAKVIIANETGKIPPNLHYKRPREDLKALEEGRIRVVTEPEPWNGGYIGVSSFGFGGANAHILFKSNDKEKIDGGAPKDDLPRLVAASGRTEEAVESFLADVESRPVDVEYIRLLHDIYAQVIPGHLYRGYTILEGNSESKKRIREIKHYPGAKRPIWFVFSGMGSQWPSMGNALLRFPIFAEAVRKCDTVLRPKNIDIYNILTNPDKSMFDNIMNSFLGIAAVQIGLVDLLAALGIVPDRIIGHSYGELGCAYADGCLTAEQMILAVYSRGLVSLETKTIYGSMAAIGLGYNEVRKLCPPDIEIACHNSSESSTISGPANSMKAFVAKLTAQEIFAKEVPCGDIAYHSSYITEAGPKLLSYLKQIIPEPKARSSKWLSTSVPRSKWSTSTAQLSSAEYHTNNFLSPVLFEETFAVVPKDAVTIEIAPHGLLQPILRKSHSSSLINIALAQKERVDNVQVFLQGIGKLFNTGYEPEISKLYPEVSFPVSRGTPMISPLIKWEHSDEWYVASYTMEEEKCSGERIIKVNIRDKLYEYMSGHVVDGKILLPATGSLFLVWETLGMMRGELYTDVSVIFEDVKFLRAIYLPKDNKAVEITLMIQKGTGRFEVIENGAVVVTGLVHHTLNSAVEKINSSYSVEKKQEMSSKDIYKELRIRGYQYRGQFKAIKSAAIDGTQGKIEWVNNWVTFLDNMLQIKLIGMDTRGLFVPTRIQKLVIDPKVHFDHISTMSDDDKAFQVVYDKILDLIVSGGVEIRGFRASAISRRRNAEKPLIESNKFVAHQDDEEITLQKAVHLATHLALENHLDVEVKTLEFIDNQENIEVEDLISPIILETIDNIPLFQADVKVVIKTNPYGKNTIPQYIAIINPQELSEETRALIVSGRNFLSLEKRPLLSQLLDIVSDGGFLFTLEKKQDSSSTESLQQSVGKYGLNIVLRKIVGDSIVLLLRKIENFLIDTVVITVKNDDFSWIDDLKVALRSEEYNKKSQVYSRILLISEKNMKSGLLGLVKCLRKEIGGEMIRAFFLQDPDCPDFSTTNPFYAEQLKQDLVINVLRPSSIKSQNSMSVWGTYRHQQLLKPLPKNRYHGWANELTRGDLSSLQWLEGPISQTCDHPDLVRVIYSAINFKDVMLATGKIAWESFEKSRIQTECVLGYEYSGIDRNNERLMGMIPSRAFTNLCIIDRNLSWKIPQNWSLEDAATVPCVYATAYYALYLSGNLKQGDKVLIHAGSGGVGQAAIILALNENCEVFTTVGIPEKRQFIRGKFPQIRDDHIGNSRDTSFEQMILSLTNGRGVDIVLNSLAGEKLKASIRCLARGGRFLEIGRFDMEKDTSIGMAAFLKEISFHGISLDNLFDASDDEKLKLQKMLQEGLDNRVIKPLTRSVFPRSQLEAAFRFMGAGKHIGKVIVKILDDENTTNIEIPTIPRFYCLPDRSYLILGGLGGFGMELCDWLVLRGAKNLVITSRSGVTNGYRKMRIKLWKSYGTNVLIIIGKHADNRQHCHAILNEAVKIAPLDGIFNLAVNLKDSLFENQTSTSFAESFKAKAWSTKNLDELSRKLCPNLRQFVAFSSVACGRGNLGQTNYGMSNSIMERICEIRALDGLPALAIQWGVVGDVGIVADMGKNNDDFSIIGTCQQGISSCLQQLDVFLNQPEPVVSSIVISEKQNVLGKHILENEDRFPKIVGATMKIMGLRNLEIISQHTSLAELGMDSMIATEIKQMLEREFKVFFTMEEIWSLNFTKLSEINF